MTVRWEHVRTVPARPSLRLVPAPLKLCRGCGEWWPTHAGSHARYCPLCVTERRGAVDRLLRLVGMVAALALGAVILALYMWMATPPTGSA